MKNATQKAVFPSQTTIVATLPLLGNTKKIEPLYINFSPGVYEANLAKGKVHRDPICQKTLDFLQVRVTEMNKSGHQHHQSVSAIAIGESDVAYQVVTQDGDDIVSFLLPKKPFVTETSIANRADIAGIKIDGNSTGTFWRS